jgi:HK97 gp10 family phage protein
MAVEFDDRAFTQGLARALDALRAASERNLTDLADVVEQEAKQRVPVRTGRLKRSFKRKTRRTLDTTTIDVINDAPYAALVEFGTSRTQPQPYMRPAQDQARSRANSILRRR